MLRCVERSEMEQGGTDREGEEVVTRGGEKVEGYDGVDTCGAGEGVAL